MKKNYSGLHHRALCVGYYTFMIIHLVSNRQSVFFIFQNWEIPLGRRFRSIKLWFVMRMVGLEGLRSHVRRDVAAAKHFESLVREDDRFEIAFPVTLALVCIRLCHKDADLKVSP